ncbi:hypothetical protein C8R43DRAFT_443439 [Mycena crocata]|nr:hypothetical protein C8R43DRAFT_443439 [Mycena crocata]
MEKEAILIQLRTSYLPTPVEIEDTQRELASLSAELASLAAEQAHLEERIGQLTARRHEINHAIELQAALIAPIRRIPDDVIQDIFLACLPTHRNAVMATSEAPLILCRICSAWRALALATPRIWASLHIPLAFSIEKSPRTQAIVEWLVRSASCPLSLSICSNPADIFSGAAEPLSTNSSYREHSLLLETLARSAPRWRDIMLSDLPRSYSRKLCASTAPLLQVVRIKDDSGVAQWSKLCSVSNVRTLDLQVEFASEPTLIVPVLSHITHLSIAAHGGSWGPLGISGILALGILQNLKQLVSLKIRILDLPVPSGHTSLPVLKSLELHSSQTDVERLLENIIMPALLHLFVDVMELSNPTPSTWLSSRWATFSQHSPLVQNLEFTLISFTRDTLRQTLQNFPSLVTLVLIDSGGWRKSATPDTGNVLTLLAEPTSTNVCPSLRTLEIRHTVAIADEILIRFLQARVDAGGPFRLKIGFEVSNNAAVQVPDLERFTRQGIQVSIIEHPSQWGSAPSTAWTGLPVDSE